MSADKQDQIDSPPAKPLITPSDCAQYVLLVIIYLLALFCLGTHMMLPGCPGFALYVCWVCGLLGGKLMVAMKQPALLGMLIAGILLRNIGEPSLVEPLPDTWAGAVRVFGLSVILMRSGLELDLSAIKRIGAACVRLTVLPGCSEAMVVGAAGAVLFQMPIALSLSLGFILAAVSPAVVVGGMFDLQSRGYGTAKGIPSLVVAAASFDDVVAITGYSLCIGFAVPSEEANLLWEAMHGPINVGLGTVLGFAGGMVVAYNPMWDTDLKRTLAAGLVGLMLAFGCNMLHFTGAGALASLISTCVAAAQWTKLANKQAEERKAHEKENNSVDTTSTKDTLKQHADDHDVHDDASHWAHAVETNLAVLWSLVAQPLLFCVIGSALNFRELDPSTIPLSIIVILLGVAVRCPVAGAAVSGCGLNRKEQLFVGLAWIPKATVQAALGGIPLEVVRANIDKHENPELFAKYEKWGLQILTTAVFSILITAPIGLLVIQNLGDKWLSYDGAPQQTDEEEEVEVEATDSQRDHAHHHAPSSKRDTITMRSVILNGEYMIKEQNSKDVLDPEDIQLPMSGADNHRHARTIQPPRRRESKDNNGAMWQTAGRVLCGGACMPNDDRR